LLESENSDQIAKFTNSQITFFKPTVVESTMQINSDIHVTANSSIVSGMQFHTQSSQVGFGFQNQAFENLAFFQKQNGDVTVRGPTNVKFMSGTNSVLVLNNDTTQLITNSFNINGDVTTTGDFTASNMNVQQTATFNGNLTVNSNMDVQGISTFNNTLTVHGDSTLSTLITTNSMVINGDLHVNGEFRIVDNAVTVVSIKSDEIEFKDNAITLAKDTASLNDLVDKESGIYVVNSQTGFVYEHHTGTDAVPGAWKTKRSDLAIDYGNRLYFAEDGTFNSQAGWSMKVDYSVNTTDGDLAFCYGDTVRFRVLADDDDDEY
jgi:cytoskeletal protein CcmA (bactofilin family)